MEIGAITGYIDVAQLVLYAFWLFFAGLIFHLVQENKREGYPLVSDRPNVLVQGLAADPAPKTFRTLHGDITVPRADAPEVINARPTARFPGAPLEPIGDPMLAAVGPGSYAQRADIPDYTFDDEDPKIVPLRSVPQFFLAWEDPNVIGMTVHGADGVLAGKVVDAWVDRSEVVIRYLEVELAAPAVGKRVLLPMNFIRLHARRRDITVWAITGAQFANVPTTKHPEIITMLEEEKVLGYFGGGLFYARPGRAESLL